MFSRQLLVHIALPSLIGLAAAATGASAATWTVNSLNDAVDAFPGDSLCETSSGNGECTLRAAVQEANALPGPDRIDLPAGTYVLTIAGSNEDGCASGDLDITEDLEVRGEGADVSIIDASTLDRVMHVVEDPTLPSLVKLADLTLQNGRDIGGGSGRGGGVLNSGALKLRRVHVLDNTASGQQWAQGGGVYSSGELSLSGCLLRNNEASGGNGASGDAGGDGGTAEGGAVYAEPGSLLLVEGSTVTGNRATGGDGGTGGMTGPGYGGYAWGGGVSGRGDVVVRASTIAGNSVSGGASGNSDCICFECFKQGTGGHAYGGGLSSGEQPLVLTDVDISGNQANGGAGVNCGGGAGVGGGLFADGDSTLTHVAIEDNTATVWCCALGGGGIALTPCWEQLSPIRHLLFRASNCSISGNEARGLWTSAGGGGILARPVRDCSVTVRLENTTLSGNSATAGGEFWQYGRGGAVYGYVFRGGSEGGVHITLSNCTVTDNEAVHPATPDWGQGGGLYAEMRDSGTATVVLANTILAGNRAVVGPDCLVADASIESMGYSIVGDVSGCDFIPGTGDQTGDAAQPLDPVVGPLQDNGGLTRTHALLAASPALDGGDPAGCLSAATGEELTADQRGITRPLDGDGDLVPVCDVGAYEWNVGLGDRVWLDANQDGIQDAGEFGYAATTVNLLDPLGALIDTTATDALGLYWFSELPPGEYTIEFVAPSLHGFSPPNQGADESLDSDADPTTGRTGPVDLPPDTIISSLDAGLRPATDPTCEAASITAIENLMVVKLAASDDLELSWDQDQQAGSGYNVWSVSSKPLLPACASCDGSTGVDGCTWQGGTPDQTRCVHVAGAQGSAGSINFYQVRGVCDGLEAAW
jgi:CSLREA domain-containing protein